MKPYLVTVTPTHPTRDNVPFTVEVLADSEAHAIKRIHRSNIPFQLGLHGVVLLVAKAKEGK